MAKTKRKPVAVKKSKKGQSNTSSRSAHKKNPTRKKQSEKPMAVLNSQNLKKLYALMMKSRMLDKQTNSTEIKYTIFGFEAALVGAGAHLQAQDCVAMEHSGFIASMIKGTPLASIFGRAQSTDRVHAIKDLNMTRVCDLARELKGKGPAMLMFSPHDSGTLVFEREAMALAAKEKLPLVCMVEKSLAIEEAGKPNKTAYRANSAFYPTIAVDGGDVVAVFRVTQEAFRRAREGHGPALIECFTSRANQMQESMKQSLAQDPLAFMEQYLRKRKLWSNQWAQKMSASFTGELKKALDPSLGEKTEIPFDNVYSETAKDLLRHTKVSSPQEPGRAAL